MEVIEPKGIEYHWIKMHSNFHSDKNRGFLFFYIYYKCIISIILWWHKHFHTLLIFYVSPLVLGIRLGFGANKDKRDEDNVFLFFILNVQNSL
jgi:hypothetical protein